MRKENEEMKKRLISLLLVVVLILTLLPLAVMAENTDVSEGVADVSEPVAEDYGTVIAVLYGPAFTEMLDAIPQGEKLFNESTSKYGETDSGSCDSLKSVADELPEETKFVLVDRKGHRYELKETSLTGSAIVEDICEADPVASELDKISTGAYRTYTADVPAGNYTLVLSYIDEPYGLVDTSYLTQPVTVEAGKTVITGEKKTVSGYSEIKEEHEDGTKEEWISGHWENWKWIPGHYEIVPNIITITTPIDHTLNFNGFYLREENIAFQFTVKDVADEPVAGAEFIMVSRDEMEAVLGNIIALGAETVSEVLGNLFDPEVFSFTDVVALHAQLLKPNENGMVQLDMETVQNIVMAYMALLPEFDLQKMMSAIQLPAILKATSDENGVVAFSESSYATIRVMLTLVLDIGTDAVSLLAGDNELIKYLLGNVDLLKMVIDPNSVDVEQLSSQQFIDMVKGIPGIEENAIMSTVLGFGSYLSGWIDQLLTAEAKKGILTWISDFVMDSAYNVLHQTGLVGEKMPSGKYLMFQTKAPEGYQKSILLYTIRLDWDTPENVYVKVADLGFVGPYVAKGFYDFVRNTDYEGPVAKYFGLKSLEYGISSKLLRGTIDLTKASNQVVQGAFTAFMADSLYNALGVDKLYKTQLIFMNGINDYLIENGTTASNLRSYVNTQAKKAKSIFAGNLDEGWVVYNTYTSPTATVVKMIETSTDEIAAAMPEGSAKQLSVKESGAVAAEIVKQNGEKAEAIANDIKSKLETGLDDAGEESEGESGSETTSPTPKQSAISKIVSTAKAAVSKLTSGLRNLFSR